MTYLINPPSLLCSCSADLRRKFGSAVLMFGGGGLWWGLGDDRYTDKKMPDRGIGH